MNIIYGNSVVANVSVAIFLSPFPFFNVKALFKFIFSYAVRCWVHNLK